MKFQKIVINFVCFLVFIFNDVLPEEQNFDLSLLPEPYCNVEQVLPFNGHGWYANARFIEALFYHNSIKTVIEVGSWLGRSTRHIASLLPDDGTLYAVDTWQGSIAHHEDAYYASMLPTLYDQFLSNVIHAGFTGKIIPMKMNSMQAAEQLWSMLDGIDLIYIDAEHTTEAVLNDLQAYYPLVANHKGIICGDDWLWQSVVDAVCIFAQSHNLTVYCGENFWFLAQEDGYAVKCFFNMPLHIWKFPKIIQ